MTQEKFWTWLENEQDYSESLQERSERFLPLLETYSFKTLMQLLEWGLDKDPCYSYSSYAILVYALRKRDAARADAFFSQPSFPKYHFLYLLETLALQGALLDQKMLESRLAELQKIDGDDPFRRRKIAYLLLLLKAHGTPEMLARIQAAEESLDWDTVEILLQKKLRDAAIPDPAQNPWAFLHEYGGDPDHLENAPTSLRAIFAVFEFDAHICGDGLLIFEEHDYYAQNPTTPRYFASLLRIIGDREMADLMERFEQVYQRYMDPSETTSENFVDAARPFEDEYFTRNAKMRVLAYRYLLNNAMT